MKQDVEFEEVSKETIFICRDCHCRIVGGKDVHLRFNKHDKTCGSKSFDYVVPGDKYYDFILNYKVNYSVN
jgi:hypothetical protein